MIRSGRQRKITSRMKPITRRAIGRQVYLICIILVVGFFAAIWLVNLAANPLGELLAYAVGLARGEAGSSDDKLLSRDDEVGHLAHLFLHFSGDQKSDQPDT